MHKYMEADQTGKIKRNESLQKRKEKTLLNGCMLHYSVIQIVIMTFIPWHSIFCLCGQW